MLKFARRFMRDENGAVTVDWVVLCAGLALLAAVISAQMSGAALSLAGMVTDFMTGWTH